MMENNMWMSGSGGTNTHAHTRRHSPSSSFGCFVLSASWFRGSLINTCRAETGTNTAVLTWHMHEITLFHLLPTLISMEALITFSNPHNHSWPSQRYKNQFHPMEVFCGFVVSMVLVCCHPSNINTLFVLLSSVWQVPLACKVTCHTHEIGRNTAAG